MSKNKESCKIWPESLFSSVGKTFLKRTNIINGEWRNNGANVVLKNYVPC